jgi:hypothetical protein
LTRNVVPLEQRVQRLSRDEFFSNLALERDAMGTMLRHGFHFSRSPTGDQIKDLKLFARRGSFHSSHFRGKQRPIVSIWSMRSSGVWAGESGVLFMAMIAEIQRRHLISKESISSIARNLKLSRLTVRKHCRTQSERSIVGQAADADAGQTLE